MKYNIKALVLFLFAILLCSLFACKTPQQRLSKLQDRYPELFTKTPMDIRDSGSLQLKEPTEQEMAVLDSLLDVIADCGSVTSQLHDSGKNTNQLPNKTGTQSHKQRIKDKIKDLYKDKPCIAPGDTLKYYADSNTVFRIWQVGDKLEYDHYKLITVDKANIVKADCELPEWVWPVIIALCAMLSLMVFIVLIRR